MFTSLLLLTFNVYVYQIHVMGAIVGVRKSQMNWVYKNQIHVILKLCSTNIIK